MKALCIKQPRANLVAAGKTGIEARSWATRHRGDLLIVSSKQPNIAPAGMALAIAELVDCRPMTEQDEAAAGCPKFDGAFAWVLRNVRRVEPFAVLGRRRLFDVELPKGRKRKA